MARPKNRSSCLRLITLKANISSRRLARARCVRYPFTCCFLGKSAISQQLLAVSALSAKVGWGISSDVGTWSTAVSLGATILNAAGNQFGRISTSLPSPGWGRRNNPHSGDSANLCAITFRPKTVACRVVVSMRQLRSNPAAESLDSERSGPGLAFADRFVRELFDEAMRLESLPGDLLGACEPRNLRQI